MKTYIVEVNNNEYEVKIREKNESDNTEVRESKNTNQRENKRAEQEDIKNSKPRNEEKEIKKTGSNQTETVTGEGEEVISPMSGKILSISANEGDNVNENEVIMTLEAMKMETEIVSPVSGKISNILVSEGDKCKQGDKLALVEAGGN